MGSKRKRNHSGSHLRKKIKRLKEQLRNMSDDSSGDDDQYQRYYPDLPSARESCSSSLDDEFYLEESDGRGPEIRSCVGYNTSPDVPHIAPIPMNTAMMNPSTNTEQNLAVAGPSTSSVAPSLSADILEALGDPKGKEETLGPKIPEEIAKRWGRILVDGLTKEQKQEIIEKHLIPENFCLAKAPLLNPEIIPVLSEPARNRDKLLERSQNQLGLGISALTCLAAYVIQEDSNIKIEILKRISEISQIFLDLHFEDTRRRRKLVTSSLDKKFMNMVTDVKRDNFLFGNDLGEKIKAAKTAERSGLQIRRNEVTAPASRKYPQQGNWRGPPRTQPFRPYKQGGPRNRYPTQSIRRPPPTQDRQPRQPMKSSTKTHKTQ